MHGFKLEGTNVNMMVIPGQVSSLTYRFDTPGEYNWVCHEYCGTGHAGHVRHSDRDALTPRRGNAL